MTVSDGERQAQGARPEHNENRVGERIDPLARPLAQERHDNLGNDRAEDQRVPKDVPRGAGAARVEPGAQEPEGDERKGRKFPRCGVPSLQDGCGTGHEEGTRRGDDPGMEGACSLEPLKEEKPVANHARRRLGPNTEDVPGIEPRAFPRPQEIGGNENRKGEEKGEKSCEKNGQLRRDELRRNDARPCQCERTHAVNQTFPGILHTPPFRCKNRRSCWSA